MSKNIFLTGAGGLLGTHFLYTLENTEDSVTALTSKTDVLAEKFGERYTYLDTSDFLENGYNFSRTDIVIHCAFPRNNDGASMAKGLDFQRILFQSASEGGAGALVNISSQSVYNPKRTEPADEQTPLVLETKYAAAKYMSEQLVEVICNASNIKYTNLRMASLIGINFNQRIVNRFVKSAVEQGSISVNAGKQSFGFLDVRDAASALKAIIFSNPDKWNNIYNIGAEREWGILELAELVREFTERLTDKKLEFNVIESEEVFSSALDSSSFSNQFGWKPQISMQQFINEILTNIYGLGR